MADIFHKYWIKYTILNELYINWEESKISLTLTYKLWGAMCFKDTNQKYDHCYVVYTLGFCFFFNIWVFVFFFLFEN